jgi:anti-anti-sigma factor
MMAQPSHMWMEVTQVGDVTIVRFTQESLVGDETSWVLGDRLCQMAQDIGSGLVVLNFKQVAYMGSAMLAQLVRLHQKVEELSGRVALCAISPELLPVFETTGLKKLLPIFADEQEAIQKSRILNPKS